MTAFVVGKATIDIATTPTNNETNKGLATPLQPHFTTTKAPLFFSLSHMLAAFGRLRNKHGDFLTARNEGLPPHTCAATETHLLAWPESRNITQRTLTRRRRRHHSLSILSLVAFCDRSPILPQQQLYHSLRGHKRSWPTAQQDRSFLRDIPTRRSLSLFPSQSLLSPPGHQNHGNTAHLQRRRTQPRARSPCDHYQQH